MTREAGGGFCFTLCDGLGGHAGGAAAARCACEAIGEAFDQAGDAPLASVLERGICAAQDGLARLRRASGTSNGMLTTLACLMLRDWEAVAAYAGDSRIYQFRGGRIVAQTLDHSVAQRLASLGRIAQQDVRAHEDRNRLLRVLGQEEEEAPRDLLWHDALAPAAGDAFLLCSDGLWEWITEDEMEARLSAAATPADWLHTMRAQALARGKGNRLDNCSAIAVFVASPV